MSATRKAKRVSTQVPVGFVSFSDVVADGAAYEPVSPTHGGGILDNAVYTGGNAVVTLQVRKVLKKDPTTRQRALRELKAILQACSEADRVGFVSYFVSLYRRLIFDNSRCVREELTSILCMLLATHKTAFTPSLMQGIIGAWWMAASDPVPDIEAAALSAFESAIPPKKRDGVLTFLAPSVFEFVAGILRGAPANDTLFKGCTDEEAQERQQRCELAGYRSIVRLLSGGEGAADSTRLSDSSLKSSILHNDTYTSLIYQQLWGRVGETTASIARAGMYDVITSLAVRLPELTRVCVFAASENRAIPCEVRLTEVAVKSRFALIEMLRKEIRRAPSDEVCIGHALHAYTHMHHLCPELLSMEGRAITEPILLNVISSLNSCFTSHRGLMAEHLLPLIGTLPTFLVTPDCSAADISSSVIDDLNDNEQISLALSQSSLVLHRVYALLLLAEKGPEHTVHTAMALAEATTYLMLVREKTSGDIAAADLLHSRLGWLGKLFIENLVCILRFCFFPVTQRTTREVVAYPEQRRSAASLVTRLIAQFQRVSTSSALHHSTAVDWTAILWAPLSDVIGQTLVEMSVQCADDFTIAAGDSSVNQSERGMVYDFLDVLVQQVGTDMKEGHGLSVILESLRSRAEKYFAAFPSSGGRAEYAWQGVMWADALSCVHAKKQEMAISGGSIDDAMTLTRGAWLESIFNLLDERAPLGMERRIQSILSDVILRLASTDDSRHLPQTLSSLISAALASKQLRAVNVALHCTVSDTNFVRHNAICATVCSQLKQETLALIEQSSPTMNPTQQILITRRTALLLQINQTEKDDYFLPSLCKVWRNRSGTAREISVNSLILRLRQLLKGGSGEIESFVRCINSRPSDATEGVSADGLTCLLLDSFQTIVQQTENGSDQCAEMNMQGCWADIMTSTYSFININVKAEVLLKIHTMVRISLWGETDEPASSLQRTLDCVLALQQSAGEHRECPAALIGVFELRDDCGIDDVHSLGGLLSNLETTLLELAPGDVERILMRYASSVRVICRVIERNGAVFTSPCSGVELKVNLANIITKAVQTLVAVRSGIKDSKVLRSAEEAVDATIVLVKCIMRAQREIESEGDLAAETIGTILKNLSPFSSGDNIELDGVIIERIVLNLWIPDVQQVVFERNVIFLDTPIPGDSISLETENVATYLRITDEDDSVGDGLISRPVAYWAPARIAGIHSDGPPEAPYYYSVALAATATAPAREIQTEPHRILLSPSVEDLGSVGKVEMNISSAPFKDSGIFLGVIDKVTTPDTSGHSVVDLLCAETLRSVNHILSYSAKGKDAAAESILRPASGLSIPPSKLPDVTAHCRYLCSLVRCIGRFVDSLSAEKARSIIATQSLQATLCVCRGSCIQYLACSSSLRTLPAVSFGLDLLEALMSSRWGSGLAGESGSFAETIWLSLIQPSMWALLHILSTASRLVFSAEDKKKVLYDLSACFAGVLPNGDRSEKNREGVHIEWRFLRQYVLKKVLQQSIAYLTTEVGSSTGAFESVFLECMLSVWSQSRTKTLSGKYAEVGGSASGRGATLTSNEAAAAAKRLTNDPKAAPKWEVSALAIVLNVFIEKAKSNACMQTDKDFIRAVNAIDIWVTWYGSASVPGGLFYMLKETGVFNEHDTVRTLWGIVDQSERRDSFYEPFCICAAKLLYIWYSEPNFLVAQDDPDDGRILFSRLADVMDFADQHFFSDPVARMGAVSDQEWARWLLVENGGAMKSYDSTESIDPEMIQFVQLERNDACRDFLVLTRLLSFTDFFKLLRDSGELSVRRSEAAPISFDDSDKLVSAESGDESDGSEEIITEESEPRTLHLYLRWILLLQQIDSLGKLSTPEVTSGEKVRYSEDMADRIRDACLSALGTRSSNLISQMLSFLLWHLATQGKQIGSQSGVVADNFLILPVLNSNRPDSVLTKLNMHCLYSAACVAPSLVRMFYDDDSSRGEKAKLKAFVERHVSGVLRAKEIGAVLAANASGRWNDASSTGNAEEGELSVSGSRVSGEVVAVYSRDDASVEMHIKIPSGYPLRNVEVECTGRLASADGRWRRWVLQIITLLSQKDGSIVDAVLLWRKNVDKEFEGVEPCPICYSTLHPKKLCLPTLQCATCHNKFHPTCLYTWFQSSGKSKCVICQQNFVFTGSGRK